jgi:hypothetical protein
MELLLPLVLAALVALGATLVVRGLLELVGLAVPALVVPVLGVVLAWLLSGLALALAPVVGWVVAVVLWHYWLGRGGRDLMIGALA